MTTKVAITDDYQITIPEEARRALRIAPGDRMLLEIRDSCIILLPEPRDFAEFLRGLHSEIWKGIDAQDYVRQEREAWQE